MGYANKGFPAQQLPFREKTKKWRKANVDFADSRSLLHYNLTRKSVFNMKINYDLLNGKLHMEDLKLMLNPYGTAASYIPDNIQHYPVMNSKLQVLRGEESKRVFDFRVVVTNPNAISEIEENKKEEMLVRLRQMVADDSASEDEFNRNLEKLGDYFTYEWQDMREVRANQLLNHYIRELEIPQLFNAGFLDAMCVGEEVYQCDIVGGEPVVERLDPMKVRILRSGYSNRIEDADIIIIEDYWSPGRIIDTYWDQLSKEDLRSIEESPNFLGGSYTDDMGSVDPRYGLVHGAVLGDTDAELDPLSLFDDDVDSSLLPYDLEGNVRVLKVYWKSRRKIKKVKSYDPVSGEEQFNFYPETYVADADKGEEEESFWINEAWEGIKIGTDIYISMRPRPVQYNRLSNPSRCHFGIVGSIYNINGDKPFSLVDMMKPYAYLYDVIHDRLNKVLAKNKGKILRLDFAKVPKGWDVDKWLYFVESSGIAVENSFKEGEYGAATGKIAGAMNTASSGVIDASLGTEIVQYCNLLDFITNKMGDMAGISRQREGQISNRETVGGVERATLQSSHITEYLFFTHESVKKRVLECLLETAKIAMKGKGKRKFEYITTDGAVKQAEIEGDEFAECDYGLVVDNGTATQELNQKLDVLTQAAVQNQYDLSTIIKLYNTTSVAERERILENDEKRRREESQQQQQQQLQLQQQQLQQQAQLEQERLDREYKMHQEKLETQVLVAKINAQAEADRLAMMNMDNQVTSDQQYQLEKDKLAQDVKEFDAKLRQDEASLELKKRQHEDDMRIKERQLRQQGK